MPTPAELWQQRQRAVSDATAAAVLAQWSKVRATDAQRSFEAALPQMLAAVLAGQLAAATGAEQYVGAVLLADGLTPEPVATVPPRRFAGVSSDGRPLVGLLTQPLLRTLYLRTRGADDAAALAGGRLSLDTVVRTEILDTGRDATQVAMGLERQVKGHIRQVHLPACPRCLVLAGRFYSKSKGFQRHPRCDCTMTPVTRDRKPDESDQDPRALFAAMTPEQQDRGFGKANAEVIRRGGDIGQVVNAGRGMATAGDNFTTAGAGRGQRRPSPGSLLEKAGDDPDAFARALERAGYL